MLRLIFVFGIIAIGAFYSLRGPFYALLFYLWNAYFRPEYWVWDDTLWSLRLSLIIGTFLLLSSIPWLSTFRWTRQSVLIIAFLMHSSVSLLLSPHQELALPFWTEFAKVIIVTLLITVLVNTEQRYRMTLIVIAFSLGFEAAKQGWAQLVLNPGATNNNPHLMLGDNNGVAMGMMMLIPIFMALSQTTNVWWERFIYRFFIGGVVYRAISTYSRGGFLAAALVGIVGLWRAKHRLRTIAIVTVLCLVIAAVMPQTFWDRMQTITAAEEERDASAQGRLYFWSLAREMARDSPLFGVGINSFRYSYSSYDRTGGALGEERAVHSTWFGVLAELGYPGLLLLLAILFGALRSCHRIRKGATARGLSSIAAYAANAQTSLLVFIIGGTFLNAQYLELMWHMVGLTIALEGIFESAIAHADAPKAATPAADLPPAAARVSRPAPARARSAGGGFFAR